MTWLLGNRLITVTTSGCSNKAMRGGLCDNCWIACKSRPQSPEHIKSSQTNLRRLSSLEVYKTVIYFSDFLDRIIYIEVIYVNFQNLISFFYNY